MTQSFMHYSAPTNLEYGSHGFMTKKNVYKIKGTETTQILCFTISNLKSARTHKWRRVVLSLKSFYSGIDKLILQFPYSFHILCTTLSTVCFYAVLSMFPFLFYWLHLKVGTVPSNDSCLFRKRSTSGQLTYSLQQMNMKSNTPWVTYHTLHSK